MAVRSTRLFGPIALPVGGDGLLFVPAGRTAVVRTVVLSNAGPLATSAFLQINSLEFWRGPIAIGAAVVVPYFVLDPGDLLSGSSASGLVAATGSGSLLLGEPT